jgi:uncharacterized protein (TIGR00369 family)
MLMEQLPQSRSCFVCGARNPVGLQLRFETDGAIARTTFVPKPEHGGFQSVVHGGILATVLDEVMVWAIGVRTGQFAYCAELTVRYLAPARPGEALIATAELIENKRGRLFIVKSELRNPQNQAVAAGSGKYMPVRDIDYELLTGDFEGSPEQLKRLFPGPTRR